MTYRQYGRTLAESRRRAHAAIGEWPPREAGEGPLVEIKTRQEFEAWLRRWPRRVGIALAARAALRVLPVLQTGINRYWDDRLSEVLLPVFRATAVSWAAAANPAHETKLAASRAANAANDAAHIFATDADVIPADTEAASYAAAAAARAASATDVITTDAQASSYAADAAFDAADAITADAHAAHFGAAVLSAVSIDATHIEEGAAASVIAGSPLWTESQPDRLRSLWQEMKASLHAAGQDWQVWTIWYDDRLDGRVRDVERELAYVRIEERLWDQGPIVVNGAIRGSIEEHEPPPHTVQLSAMSAARGTMRASMSVVEHTPPAPIENISSAVSFGWTSTGTITVVSGPQNWPVFPFQDGQQDHANRLEACRALATDITRSLRSGNWNARSDYADTLDQYVAHLPNQSEVGNFLLADAEARIIRAMFVGDVGCLPLGLAAKLQILLEQHIGLRAYYPETEDFYESVRTGHLERPLPIDAIDGFIKGVRDHTPTRFEPNVAIILENTAQSIPAIGPADSEAPRSGVSQPAPPPDPLGEVDPEKARRFTLASGVNALWKVMTSGKKVDENVKGWKEVVETLGPYALPILEWLRSFVGG